jgi:RimJ/RimL family protein N-acetyltransferase
VCFAAVAAAADLESSMKRINNNSFTIYYARGRRILISKTADSMSANPSAEDHGGGPSAGQVISLVSPHDQEIAIGPILPDDLGLLFTWLNDETAARSDFSFRPMDCLAYKEWIDRLSQANNIIVFMLRRLRQSRALGFVVFKNIQPAYRSAELGMRIGQEIDRSKGYGTRAACLALDYAWHTLNLHRLSLIAFSENTRAIAAYQKAGFQEEGIMRDAAFTNGVWHNVTIMAAINPHT